MKAPDLVTTNLDAAELEPCRSCGKGVLHTGNIVFYEMTIRQCVADIRNIPRMHGLELVMGGNVPLARVLSPDNTVAKRIEPGTRVLLCLDCAMRSDLQPLAVFLEEPAYG